MFGIIRIIVGCIVFFLCNFFIDKKIKKTTKRKKLIASFLASITLITALAFIPFENLFFSFKSPEESYKYVNSEISNVKLVVNGNNSDFVIGEKNNSDVYLIIPKTSSGWKVGIGTNTKRIAQKITNDVVIYVYQYKNTDDYFIAVHNIKNTNIELTDVYGSEFIADKRIYYANIQNFDQQYWVDVNSEKIIVLS